MSDLVVSGGSSAKRARRSWTIDEKRAIVDAAKRSGDPVSVVARRHGMNANHLFNWLQRDRDGTLDRRALDSEAGGPLAFVEAGVIGGGQQGDRLSGRRFHRVSVSYSTVDAITATRSPIPISARSANHVARQTAVYGRLPRQDID